MAFDLLTDGDQVLTVEKFAAKTRDFHVHNFRELIGEKNYLSFEELRDFLLLNDRLGSDDAMMLSMKFLDPQNTGFVDMKIVKNFLEKTLNVELSAKDLEEIIKQHAAILRPAP
ncbi:MAG: hypothetical protein EZS28_004097 [Streblomastix strix]|uniref:EF-hand domain-containing protein n=1 Tax=Streblomastix strix TaxID=222440 RepID=A0A5J4X0W5_9EUKA|nr:MAG: hypothetical protein EZS28_004097 [Streblomastix strix]